MNLYTRARKHIDMSRVKSMREENNQKKLLQEYNKRKELAKLRDKHSPEFSNWRGTVTEGMNTGNVFFTTLPATGETDLETISTQVSSSFEDAGGNDAFENTVVRGSGSGSGSDGGFNIGNHLAFQGDGQPRWAILKPIDSSKFDTLTISAIRGNDTNGGEDPDETGEELRLYYLPPGGSAFRSIGVNPEGQQVQPADYDVIIPLGSDDSGLKDYQIKLPSYARGAAFRYMLYQLTNSGTGFDNYGIKNVRYQRKAPLSLFVPLDSPEAVSFINDGSGGLSPEEKKKRLEDMLAASDEYQSRQFPFNKAAYDKAARDVSRNIQISLDPDTFKFPEYQTPAYNDMFPSYIDSQSSTEQIDRYLEQRGLTVDSLAKDFDKMKGSFTTLGQEGTLLLINNPDTQEKVIAAMGIDFNIIKNLTDDTYRKLSKMTSFTPGGTPSTGWNGKFYMYNDPQLEASQIVPLETYIEAKKRDDFYGVEKPDRVEPGKRYVIEKQYSFSKEATPTYTGPRNKQLDDASKTAHDRMYSVGASVGDLGFRWDLTHFEKGLGSGLKAGSNFARGQVVESMTAVLNHMYNNADLFAYMYAGGGVYGASGTQIDTMQPYDPLFFLFRSIDGISEGKRALDIALNTSARQLDYGRDDFGGSDPERLYQNHLKENDRTVENFQEAYRRIKTLSTDFATYDKDEWYSKDDRNVVAVKKVHPYSGLPEPGLTPEEPTPEEPTPEEPTKPEEKNYPPELNDIGGQAWESGNTITKEGFKKSDGDFDVFVAGGGNAKMAEGFTYEQVMEIGRKNLNVLSVKGLDNKTNTKFQYKNGNLNPIGYSVANERIDNAINYSSSLAVTLGLSILTGQSREIKLGDRGRQDMIQSVNSSEFESALKIGRAIRPTVDNAVNPTPGKKLNVFNGLWGVPGAAEVDYNPATDTLTFTLNKMLRKGKGDEYNEIGTVITKFGDIPTPTTSSLATKSATILQSLAASIGIKPKGGWDNKMYGPNFKESWRDDLANRFTNNQLANAVLGAASQVVGFSVQGSASNIVALRNLMTNAGLVRPSAMERTYGGYGHVYTQTSYTGSQIPQELRQIINRKTGKVSPKDELGGGSLGDVLQGTDATDAATAGADNKKKNKNNTNTQTEMYEPKAKHNDKVAKVTGRLKSVSDFLNHPDVKPVFPKDPPPEMINGRHPDLVDGEKVSNRYNRLDPISAKAMPKTGNPNIDAKVAKALKRPK